MPVRLGIDRFLESPPAVVDGARIGLVTNDAARDALGRTTLERCLAAGLRVEALLAPEHGLDLSKHEGEVFGRTRHPSHAIPVIPFYGEGMKLSPASVAGLDLLVFDLPNVGLRCHTYLANVLELVRLSSQLDFPVAILDRPLALGAWRVEGELPAGMPESDVCPAPVPFRHGLAWTEMARWYAATLPRPARVYGIEMAGYERRMWPDETGIPWVPPSPNLPSVAAALAYPATVWLEGTNLSEGRGTERPFETFGAPWLDAAKLGEALSALGLPGVSFEPIAFVPRRSKHAGERCRGLRMAVRDRAAFQPLVTGWEILRTLGRLHPGEFGWLRSETTGLRFVDRLYGSGRLREAVDAGGDFDSLLAAGAEAAARFRERCGAIMSYR